MDNASFGGIVCGLQLWNIDDVPAHTSGRNKGSVCVVLQLLTVQVGPFFLLASPVCCSGPSTIEGAIKVSSNNLAVVINFSIEHSSLSPRDASVGNKDIEASVELLDNFVDRLLDVLCISDIDLVCLA